MVFNNRKHLGDLLKSSYMPQHDAKEHMKKLGYGYDHELSNMETKVFVSPQGKPIIAHRGSKRIKDFIDDGLLAFGLEKYSKRFQDAKKITQQVQNKYKSEADAVGHSLGGSLAEKSKNGGEIITYNKGTGLLDMFKKKNSGRQLDITTKGDLVNGLGITQNANKEIIENNNKSNNFFHNALNAHKVDNLFPHASTT